MIRHIVLFTLKDGISGDDERVRKAFDELGNLKARIDFIRDWEIGDNFSERPIAVNYGLNASFDTEEDLTRYIGHEAHQAVVVLLKEVCTWVLCDYQF
jgi:hypothetical protein